MKFCLLLCVIACALLGQRAAVWAASTTDIDRMTSYAVILGRAVACGADVDAAAERVGTWMHQIFPPGSAEQVKYLKIFAVGLQQHAELQHTGKSPDSCPTVLRVFNTTPWPSVAERPTQPLTREQIREAQRLLAQQGYQPGAADGIAGAKTTEAVKAFQQQRGMAVDGEVSEQLLEELRRGSGKGGAP